jgi:hypothetical protein
MRLALALSIIGAATSLWASSAAAQVTQGNDTGGIIPWSCENEAFAADIAAHYCARWDKYSRITGVHRHYGDYISFNCLWNPRQARWALPRVATRKHACISRAVRGHVLRARD